MPQVSESQFNATIRHQVHLERLKAGEAKNFLPYLREIDQGIRLRLSEADLTATDRRRLNALLAETNQWLDGVLGRWGSVTQGNLAELATYEAAFAGKSLKAVAKNAAFEANIPAPGQLTAAVMATPLSIRGAAGGLLIPQMFKGFTDSARDRAIGAIRQGYFEGLPNQQIIQKIRGTKALRYTDGLLQNFDTQAATLVRTTVQHVSSIAQAEVWKNNDAVKGEVWTSTLDNRTTEICMSLDGQQFPIGEGPYPPAHFNCRSRRLPVLADEFQFLRAGSERASTFGPVDSKQSYFDWLKRQSAEFQDSAIGPTRGKLLREGGLSAERFRKLMVSRDYKPLTLEQMRNLEPLAFEQAGIALSSTTGRVIGDVANVTTTAATPAPNAAIRTQQAFTDSLDPAEFGVGAIDEPLDRMTWAKAEVAKLRDFVNRFQVSTTVLTDKELLKAKASTKRRKAAWAKFQEKLPPSQVGRKGTAQQDPGALSFRGKTTYGGFTSAAWSYVQVTPRVGFLHGFRRADPHQLREGVRQLIENRKAGLRGKYDRMSPEAMGWKRKHGNDWTHEAFISSRKSSAYWGGSYLHTWLHEVGHQVHFRAGTPRPPPRWISSRASLTRYGGTNSHEFFAEHFAMWVLDREGLKAAFPDLVAWLDEVIEKALGAEVIN